MNKYFPTIGLEIHAELKTRTKMFCDCPNDAREQHPNVNVCPICLGHPGVLPTINWSALELIAKLGLALGGSVSKNFKFDRKNYFYPDLPKGYQISQYDQPLIAGGKVLGIRINRIHLEEDAAKLVHGEGASLVDFNRGGVPLMELVTEPDMRSSQEAADFVRELQLMLRYLEVSDADLERGQMRVDANVSVSPDEKELGTKVEIKNLNSFSAVQAALEYEIERQSAALAGGEEIHQETRGWNDPARKTVSQRSKEEAHDYRYFPEPDLPPLTSELFDLEAIRASLPELPKEKRERFQKEYNLDSAQAALLITDRPMAAYFEEAVSELEADEQQAISPAKIKLIFNYLTTDLRGLMAERELDFEELKINPENFADLIELAAANRISSRVAKDLLARMADTGVDPETLVENEGLAQVSEEGELLGIVERILKENPAAIADYKKGKLNALQFLVGKAMAALKGAGNPEVLKKLFEENL